MGYSLGRCIALFRIAVQCSLCLVGACGGGGGAPPEPAASKLFVADSGQHGIGSVINPNPPPGVIGADRIVTATSTNFLGANIPSMFLDAARDQLSGLHMRKGLLC